MDTCPNCGESLTRERDAHGLGWRCQACGGRMVALAVLRRTFLKDAVNEVWQAAQSGQGTPGRACPGCGFSMQEVRSTASQPPLHVDVCTRCPLVWFDAKECDALPALPAGPTEPELPPGAREALAIVKVEEMARQRDAEAGDEPPVEGWKAIFGFMGLPVETEDDVTRTTPWLTWGLVALVSAVSLLVLVYAPGAIERFGFIPARAFRYGGLTFLSVFFLHGGWGHLLGNMYFLLVFGDNVEDSLGKWRFALLLLLATLAGSLAHYASDVFRQVPCIGASGGISGVLAFYALAFPRTRLSLFLRWARGWVTLPAYSFVLFWVAMQVAGAWAQLKGFSNVSAFAHLGGAATGLACWLYWRRQLAQAAADAPVENEVAWGQHRE